MSAASLLYDANGNMTNDGSNTYTALIKPEGHQTSSMHCSATMTTG
ncbi:hypothetical protein J3D54_004203 [Pseudomonas sp. GGS8]|nr:hypothetical protein [Pseudomonas sp. GGS8]